MFHVINSNWQNITLFTYRSVYVHELKIIYGSERHAKRWRGKHGTLHLFSLPFTAVARWSAKMYGQICCNMTNLFPKAYASGVYPVQGGNENKLRNIDFSRLKPDLSGYFNICFQKPEGNINMQVLCTPYLYVKDWQLYVKLPCNSC